MQFALSTSMYDSAYAHHQAGRLAEAEHLLRQALLIDPRHVDSLHLLGVIAGQAGHPEASLALFDQTVALRSDFASAHANRGVALLALGRSDDAISALRTAVELKPEHVHGLFALGNALAERNDLGGAEAAYRQALAIEPGAFAILNNLGQVLQRQGRLDEAIEAFRKALASYPDSPDIRQHLAEALRLAGETEDA